MALSSMEVLYLPNKSEYIIFLGHPSQQPQHPYWHHINTQSEGSLSYLWEIPLHTACTEAPLLTSIPPCLRASIPKLHPYWQHINTQDASIWQHINIQNASILATHQYLNCIHIGINTQTALILATHQYPKFIHAGSTSIPKIHIIITSIPKMHPYWHHINTQRRGNLGLNLCIIGDPNATCSISFNPTPPCCRAAVKGERD